MTNIRKYEKRSYQNEMNITLVLNIDCQASGTNSIIKKKYFSEVKVSEFHSSGLLQNLLKISEIMLQFDFTEFFWLCWTSWTLTVLKSKKSSFSFLIQYGISGPYWYAGGATIQIILFAILSIMLKTRAPGAKTFLQVSV